MVQLFMRADEKEMMMLCEMRKPQKFRAGKFPQTEMSVTAS